MPGEFQNRGKAEHFIGQKSTCENFAAPNVTCEKFATPKVTCENFTAHKFTYENFATPQTTCKNSRMGCQEFHNPFLPCKTHVKCQRSLMRNTNGQEES